MYITVFLTASTAWPGEGESDYYILSWISMLLEEDQPDHFLYWMLIPFRDSEFQYLTFALASITAYWVALMLIVMASCTLYKLFDDLDADDIGNGD